MEHDQNFKNLILDYPGQALALFAAAEAAAIDASARIVPVRQEQLKERLGMRNRCKVQGGTTASLVGAPPAARWAG